MKNETVSAIPIAVTVSWLLLVVGTSQELKLHRSTRLVLLIMAAYWLSVALFVGHTWHF